jgi:hypothetical protein
MRSIRISNGSQRFTVAPEGSAILLPRTPQPLALVQLPSRRRLCEWPSSYRGSNGASVGLDVLLAHLMRGNVSATGNHTPSFGQRWLRKHVAFERRKAKPAD